MSLSLNYFLEANLALCIFLAVYVLLLRNETNFSLKRIILLTGIAISLLFPALHIQGSPLHIPTFGEILPATFLPEMVVVGNSPGASSSFPVFNVPQIVNFVYLLGAGVALIIFLRRIFQLGLLIARSTCSPAGDLYIAESPRHSPPFSFFNFVFIGQADELNEREKRLIIAHESVHARQFHTADIILMQLLGIFFWFNPVVKIYKNIFIQLHEFEADARAVRTEETNDYCNLLARVALLSADIRIANHFSNSLTLKRIQMMRKIKFKIRPWKIAAMTMIVPAFFLLLSCQDQLVNEVTEIAKSSTVAVDVPAEVQLKYDQLKDAHPELKLVLMEINEADLDKLERIQAEIESKGKISSMNFITPTAVNSQPIRHFLIIEYDENVAALAERSQQDNVYTVVEESAAPVDGIESYYGFLARNISYPREAREKGLQGKVFVSFIVETDGTLSDFNIVKGVNPDLDQEALRVMMLSPKWNPGKHEGATVRQRMVLPINFLLGGKNEQKKVGHFSTPLNPLEFLHPDRKDRC